MRVTSTTLFDPTDVNAKVKTTDLTASWDETLSMVNIFAEDEKGEVLIRLPGCIIFMYETGRITRFDQILTDK